MAQTEAPQESVRELVRGLSTEVRELVDAEVALAKAELLATLRRAAWAAGGALLALLGLGIFLLFAVITLVEWLPNHTLVAAMVALAGLILVLAGGLAIWTHRRLSPLNTIKSSLQEDLEWARRQTKRIKR